MKENQATVDLPPSSQETDNTESDIHIKFRQIKEKNEEIKNQAYSRSLKENPGNKDRLLSAFDYSSNKLVMSFLKPTVAEPKSMADYSKTDLELDADAIHELDQIEFHRSNTEMLYSKIVSKTMKSIRLEKTVLNLQNQMKLDKASLYANNLRVKALEDIVIEAGGDPANIEGEKVLIKQKNEDIAALRKQLKLPQSENSQAK